MDNAIKQFLWPRNYNNRLIPIWTQSQNWKSPLILLPVLLNIFIILGIIQTIHEIKPCIRRVYAVRRLLLRDGNNQVLHDFEYSINVSKVCRLPVPPNPFSARLIKMYVTHCISLSPFPSRFVKNPKFCKTSCPGINTLFYSKYICPFCFHFSYDVFNANSLNLWNLKIPSGEHHFCSLWDLSTFHAHSGGTTFHNSLWSFLRINWIF